MRRHPHILLAGTTVDSPLAVGVMRLAKARAWQLMVADPCEALASDSRYDGAILAGMASERLDFAPRFPVVLAAQSPRALPTVATDDLAIGRLAARHYMERGFRHFAYFARRGTTPMRIRERGFAETCAAVGHTYRALFTCDMPQCEHDAAAAAAWLEHEIVCAPKPLGVFAGSDTDAMLVINACRLRGLALPDDVSILGVGNHITLSEIECVTLSSVQLDEDKVGYEAARLLARLLRSPRGTEKECGTLVPPVSIVDRQSTDVIGTDDPTLRRALSFISSNLSRPFGAAQVAEAIGMNRNRLDRLFTAELSRSIGQEILRERIALAKRLLATSHASLGEIARTAGFCNSSYLIKCFKAATGHTPRMHLVQRASLRKVEKSKD